MVNVKNVDEFLFAGLRALMDGDRVAYVHAKDLPLLVRRLHLAGFHVGGFDVFRISDRGIEYIDTFFKKSSDKYWYTRAYHTMLKKYPGAWFSPTIMFDDEADELVDLGEEMPF